MTRCAAGLDDWLVMCCNRGPNTSHAHLQVFVAAAVTGSAAFVKMGCTRQRLWLVVYLTVCINFIATMVAVLAGEVWGAAVLCLLGPAKYLEVSWRTTPAFSELHAERADNLIQYQATKVMATRGD